MKDIRQSANYAHYLASVGWQVEEVAGDYVYIKKIPILGAILKVQRPERFDIEKIEALNKKYRIFQIVIEPKTNTQAYQLTNRGYRQLKNPYLPSKTLELDLTKPEKTLFKNLKKDARQTLKKISSLELSTNPNLDIFHKSWVKKTPWQRFVPPARNFRKLQEAFGSSSLLLASHNVEAGAIFLLAGKRAYYWQAFTSDKARQSLAQYQIVWQAICWAKKKGARTFDFEGIYDSRFPNPRWLGFTTFKGKFGGQSKTYPGAFVKTYWPLITK